LETEQLSAEIRRKLSHEFIESKLGLLSMDLKRKLNKLIDWNIDAFTVFISDLLETNQAKEISTNSGNLPTIRSKLRPTPYALEKKVAVTGKSSNKQGINNPVNPPKAATVISVRKHGERFENCPTPLSSNHVVNRLLRRILVFKPGEQLTVKASHLKVTVEHYPRSRWKSSLQF
jgi:hypothetical protein